MPSFESQRRRGSALSGSAASGLVHLALAIRDSPEALRARPYAGPSWPVRPIAPARPCASFSSISRSSSRMRLAVLGDHLVGVDEFVDLSVARFVIVGRVVAAGLELQLAARRFRDPFRPPPRRSFRSCLRSSHALAVRTGSSWVSPPSSRAASKRRFCDSQSMPPTSGWLCVAVPAAASCDFEFGVLRLELADILDRQLKPTLQVGHLLLDVGVDLSVRAVAPIARRVRRARRARRGARPARSNRPGSSRGGGPGPVPARPRGSRSRCTSSVPSSNFCCSSSRSRSKSVRVVAHSDR